MRKLLYYLFILLPILAFSQASEIPEIDFKSNSEEVNRYTELFGLNDADALVVRLAYSILPHIEPESDYIVYLNNGKVRRYRIKESAQPMASPKIKRIRVKKKKYSAYWAFLNLCASEGKFSINQSQLATLGEKANSWKNAISGGQTYTFGVYQGENYTEYKSFLPSMFTDEEYPGFEDKRKLIYVMEGFKTLAKD
ncbi:hypothetical protein DFQ03_0475 [Maribacter caenipelagi]|uniref:Uncharacterized protein n=1 Tax=Maribacter caenipelagi TaxID=1447781 RepID=A0A4R7DEK4_9FLAO|nr:hypothetical protein [Maribacter caenipelagi]TDS18765.1 hypothetical protein DFQ03_0475 [Maribacter caenipelagi]